MTQSIVVQGKFLIVILTLQLQFLANVAVHGIQTRANSPKLDIFKQTTVFISLHELRNVSSYLMSMFCVLTQSVSAGIRWAAASGTSR